MQATESRPGVMSGICTRHLKTTRRYLFSQHPANIFLTIKQLLQSHRFCVGQPPWVSTSFAPWFLLAVSSSQSPVLSWGFILANCLQARSIEEKKVVTLSITQNFHGKAQDHMWSENRGTVSAYTVQIYQSWALDKENWHMSLAHSSHKGFANNCIELI